MAPDPKNRGFFTEQIKRVLSQVHPTCSINQQALDYLDLQMYQVTRKLCSTPLTSGDDVRGTIQTLFPEEISSLALKEGEQIIQSMDPNMKGTSLKRPVSTVNFHTESLIFSTDLIADNTFFIAEKTEKDQEALTLLMASLEYLCADVLKLAGNSALNDTRRTIGLDDVVKALSLDPVLQDLFVKIRLDHALIWLRGCEEKYGRDLTLLTKVFFDSLKGLKEKDNTFANLFAKVTTLYEVHKNSLQLLNDAADLNGIQAFVEAILTQKQLFSGYRKEYETSMTSWDNDPKNNKEGWRNQPAVKKLLEDRDLTHATEFHLKRLFFRPMQQLLMYEYAFSRLCELLPEEPHLSNLNTQLSTFASEFREVGFMPPKAVVDATEDWRTPLWQYLECADLQSKLEGWKGKHITAYEAKLITRGELGALFQLNGVRKYKKPKDRIFWIFDKFVICGKTADFLTSKRSFVYELRDVINFATLTIRDVPDTDDVKNAFELAKDEQHSIIVCCRSEKEKSEWQSVFNELKSARQLEDILAKVLLQATMQGPELPSELRLTVEEYRFAEADTSDNIMFEISESGVPLIKAATVIKLIERLTYDKYHDTNFLIQFLLTYRSFIEPMEMLDLLIERFNIPLPKAASKEQQEYFQQNIRRPVQLRVFNVLKNWVDKHYQDFEQNNVLLKKCLEFIDRDMTNTENMKNAAGALTKAIRNKRKEEDDESKAKGENEAPVVYEQPILTGVTENIDIMMLDPLEVARQLTIIESKLYRDINSYECLNQRWAKKKKETEAPNIIAMIDRFNLVSNWVKTLVTFKDDFQSRVELIERFIKIAERCQELNNFNGMMEIISGLNSIPVNRLKLTWNAVSKKALASFHEMMDLMSTDKSYAKFRKQLHTRKPPCIPYFGVYLTDLTFIEEGNKDIIPGTELINFSKRRRIAAVIIEIQQYQQDKYNLQIVPEIHKFLMSLEVQDDEVCYEHSLLIEPRGATRMPSFSVNLNNGNTNSSSSSQGKQMGRSPSTDGLNEEARTTRKFSMNPPKIISTKSLQKMGNSITVALTKKFGNEISKGSRSKSQQDIVSDTSSEMDDESTDGLSKNLSVSDLSLNEAGRSRTSSRPPDM